MYLNHTFYVHLSYGKCTFYVHGVYMKKKTWQRVELLDDKNNCLRKSHTNINLRIPTDLLEDIDARIRERVGIKRTGWILEALQISLQICKGEIG